MHRQCNASDGGRPELAIVVPETGAKLDALVDGLVSRAKSPLQRYVLDRLEGRPGPAWLDGEDLEHVVRATEWLGALVAFGPDAKLGGLTALEWDQDGAIGYGYTARGEAGICAALAEVQAGFGYSGSRPSPKKVFGGLYQWLSLARAKTPPGDIKRILREHIFATMEMHAGTLVLREPLPERRLHGCASLAREAKLNAQTLYQALKVEGLLPKDAPAGSHHVFDADTGRAVAASVPRKVQLSKVHKLLNSTETLARELQSERLLTPIVWELSHAPGRTKTAIDAEKVASLMSRLRTAAPPVPVLPEGMVDLATAAQAANALEVEIVRLILGGHLERVVCLDGVDGCAAIHVDPEEVAPEIARVMTGISPTEAFDRLHVSPASGWELADYPSEEVHLPTVEIR